MIALNEIVRQYPEWMQKSEFHDQMVKEYIHHHMIHILFSSRYSRKISFLGGTALRYFYNVKRFSEDLDFDCFDLNREEFIDMTNQVEKGIRKQGYDIFIEDKKKNDLLKAFRRVFVFPELKYKLGLSQQKEAKFFIKIKAEPHGFAYNPQFKTLYGFGVTTSVGTMPSGVLFSSKIAAAINRKKDRDFFDVISLINFVVPDFAYLDYRCKISNPVQLKQELLKAAIERKLDTRKIYDCTHMLFDKNDVEKLRNFKTYVEYFNFSQFEPENPEI